jgi:hypothetical protein
LTRTKKNPYCGRVETIIRWLLVIAGALAAYVTYLR